MLSELAAVTRETGARVLRCREQGRTAGNWEGTQFKAEADLVADACMRAGLRAVADIPVVSEEDAASQSLARPMRYWLVDPIDGTASFAQGFSGFVCQAAYIVDGCVELAAVFAPALDSLYMAARGQGATLNGERLATRKYQPADTVLVDNYPEPRGIARRLVEELPCASYLESGSIGLKICLVAQGAADLFVKDVTVRDWDVAAPALVLSEAGGFIHRFDGADFAYQGEFDKPGLIAAGSRELLAAAGTIAGRHGGRT